MILLILAFWASGNGDLTLSPERLNSVKQIVSRANDALRLGDAKLDQARVERALSYDKHAASSLTSDGFLTFGGPTFLFESQNWSVAMDQRGFPTSLTRPIVLPGNPILEDDGGALRMARLLGGDDFTYTKYHDESPRGLRTVGFELTKKTWSVGFVNVHFDRDGNFKKAGRIVPHVTEAAEVANSTAVPSDAVVEKWITDQRKIHGWGDNVKVISKQNALFPMYMNLDPKRPLPDEVRQRLIEGKAIPTVNIEMKATDPPQTIYLALDARNGSVLTLGDFK
jgi:hypothetical protein